LLYDVYAHLEKTYLYYYHLIVLEYLRVFEVAEFKSDYNLKIYNGSSIMAKLNKYIIFEIKLL